MAKLGNLRFINMFVFDPSTELVTNNTKKPTDLTKYQVGIFDNATGLGVGSTPAYPTVKEIVIHQNLGDNKFGTVRTKWPIHGARVVKWYGYPSHRNVQQITYFGYDESHATYNLTVYPGQNLLIPVTIWNNDLNRWYGPTGYTHLISLDISKCLPCLSDCDKLDPDEVGDFIVGYINGTLAPSNDFPVTNELKNYLTASKVVTGTAGDPGRRVGVKLVAKASADTQDLLNSSDPQQYAKSHVTTFTIGVPLNCPNTPVTTTVKAKAGNGYALEVLDLEKEAQGYDRVRDVFEFTKYMKTNYITRATDAVQYDFYYLQYDVDHRSSQITGPTRDPYIAIFAVPHGTGTNLETVLNAWLLPLGFTAVTPHDEGSSS